MTYLLDVNVLVALSWPAHQQHERALTWFGKHASQGWATCPFTQAAFVRILSNPAFSPDAVTPREATGLLSRNVLHPRHKFWADEIGFAQAVQLFAGNLAGHQQVADAYLLGLAIHKKGSLATMDGSIQALLGREGKKSDSLIVI